jgi:hypothetical protein
MGSHAGQGCPGPCEQKAQKKGRRREPASAGRGSGCGVCQDCRAPRSADRFPLAFVFPPPSLMQRRFQFFAEMKLQLSSSHAAFCVWPICPVMKPTLWRQAARILFALEVFDRRKPQERSCHRRIQHSARTRRPANAMNTKFRGEPDRYWIYFASV